MCRMRWMVYLWPGFPQLSGGGSWRALGVAALAAAGLNLALLATLVWEEFLGQGLRSGLWMTVGLLWVASAVASFGRTGRPAAGGYANRTEDGFPSALDYYLKGNWFEAERVLGGLLRQNTRDVEARLMLATLLRHTGRRDEAAVQLDLLGQLDGTERWQWEICRERELLAESDSRVDARNDEEQEEQLHQGPMESPAALSPAA
jgi:hypothetical protein